MSESKPPTLADVAQLAGVHAATASRALNPDARDLLNRKTVRRVMAAAQELGYSPNAIARALRTSKTGTVGVLLPDITNPIFPPMARGIEDALREHGQTALLADTDNDADTEVEAVAALQQRKVDGLLVATAYREHPLMEELVEAGAPIVMINRITESADVAAVVADDAGGITEAFQHLTAIGHRRISHLAGPTTMSTGSDRARAFAYAANMVEPSACPIIECERYTQTAGARAMQRLLEGHPDCTAVIAGNDLIALGAITTLREAGKSCPDDMSVVGFNDMPFLDMMEPPLTTVRVSHYDLGFEAARLLMEQLRRPSANRKVVLPTRLIVRGSTGPARDPAS